jgi:Ser/Thr protein kinase RdoA (MazF antagonist)
VVQFIDHLARCGAPCPQIFPTKEDELSFAHEDFTLSVESFLQGECSDRTDHLFNVGTALGRIHDAAESFSEFPPATRPVKDYVNPILRESTSLNLRSDFAEAAAHLSDLIRTRLAAAGSTRVLWILCRGDVRSRNTIAHRDDSVSFTDFGSAHFAPALTDVAMVQPQWLMGTTQRPLTEDEVTSYVHGYVEARASGLQDLTALPVIWAAHYLSRLCFLHSKWRLDQPGKTRWNGDDRVVTLPFDGVEMMEEAVQEVSS